jgi:hypothetical protein
MEGLDKETKPTKGAMHWLKKLGLAGVLFFFIKGLVWIAVFMGIGSLADC